MNIPNCWSEVSIRQLIEINEVKDNLSFNNYLKVAATLTGATEKEIKALPVEEFVKVIDEVNEFFQTAPAVVLRKSITLNGHEYHLRDIGDYSTGDFIDADTLATGDDKDKVPLLLALAYTESGVENTPDNIKERANRLLGLDCETALGGLDFFSKALLKFALNTVESSNSARMNEKTKKKLEEWKKQIIALTDGGGN